MVEPYRHKLTDADMARISEEMAQLVLKHEQTDTERKASAKEFKERMDEIMEEISYRATTIRRGYRLEVQEELPLGGADE